MVRGVMGKLQQVGVILHNDASLAPLIMIQLGKSRRLKYNLGPGHGLFRIGDETTVAYYEIRLALLVVINY